MKKYYVTVNGNRYEVEVEEVMGNFEPVQPQITESKALKTEVKQQEIKKETPKAAPKAVPEGGTKINAPMPGTIVGVNIKEGDKINKGDLLFVLEAMKMENEIVSPVDGTVVSVQVSKGQSVNTEDLMAVIE
ncbi:biotin/lipoyl-binding protein [Clostridium sp. YIM B02515]|uniref:Biotin/lipoyl-binding protein n=1 Tax=Clostridium rhizosphaerae TaxID=2803861 RepID=A0ABS1TFI5_9CLOT|nr:biotin/lipoyl-containing protein [Clostridium rhizosphaerae]MBL4937099.1 biotin/lipoyl-binding protein [Clostridium rhizosphaerae]